MCMSRLKPIATDVWQLPAAELSKFDGGLRMPLASTVVRLPDRSLLLYSPIALDGESVAALAAEGEVAHIVAPSLIHHMHAKAAAETFPRATLHLTPGLAAKVPALTGREIDGAGWGDIESVLIAGAPKLNETVLFHRPSGTLMCADLLFNITSHANFMTTLILKMTGTGGKELAQSRMWKMAVKDRAAARASLDRVLSLPLQFVAPSHGEPIAIDAATLAPKMARVYGGVPTARDAGRAA
jgi:hypothetical protein